MPTTPLSAKAPARGNARFIPEHRKPTSLLGYADEAPFGDIVKDPTPVPTTPPPKTTDQGGDDDAE